METRENALKQPAEKLGTAMMAAWTLMLGPQGAVLLLAVAYAMSTQNLALGLTCGLLLFAPLMFTLIWGPLAWAAVRAEAGMETHPFPLGERPSHVHEETV